MLTGDNSQRAATWGIFYGRKSASPWWKTHPGRLARKKQQQQKSQTFVLIRFLVDCSEVISFIGAGES